MSDLWWVCPICGHKVSFLDQLKDVFEEDGEASFDPKYGILVHSIICTCGAIWTLSLDGLI